MKFPSEASVRRCLSDRIDESQLTQKEIAGRIGLDASQLSRVLNGTHPIKYQHVYSIWNELERESEARQEPAESLMVKDIRWLEANETREDGKRIMQEENFSQLPVREDGEAVGWVTDLALMENPNPDESAIDLISRSMITVEPSDSRQVIIPILEEGYPAVLVEEGSEYLGLLTRFDLL
jgi:predicted transcriptional regulator